MSDVLAEVLAANQAYAATFGERGRLPAPPARRFAILTCMDARLDPAKFAGLAEGDAHVIRNAGGRASDDAISSLVISYKLLGTREWFVIHHTNCGMETLTEEVIRELASPSDGPVRGDAAGWAATDTGPGAAEHFAFLAIQDPRQSVTDDVLRLRQHPLVPGHVLIYGYIYDVLTGRLVELPEATAAGRATG
ncbi:MAG TPA: carbonic anhydrase [Chloroflexia bacterium]|nr:carbonic anhydrase [Chloroflexia bacterium]